MKEPQERGALTADDRLIAPFYIVSRYIDCSKFSDCSESSRFAAEFRRNFPATVKTAPNATR
jgi:hypothetical protein